MTWVVGGLGTAKIDVLVLKRSLLQGSEYSNPPPRQCTVLREMRGAQRNTRFGEETVGFRGVSDREGVVIQQASLAGPAKEGL